MLLAGDIGGTKTALAIVSPTAGPRHPVARAVFPSQRYASLEDIVREFLAQGNWPVETACFGVAGPVVAGQARVTNLPWIMDETRLAQDLRFRAVRLLNDLEAIATAVPHLGGDDLYRLHTGQLEPGGALAVIAPGTGLGEAYLTWDGRRYQAHASEGGHADFAPTDECEIGLLQYLMQRFGHVSYERVCSGIGIPNIYAYLKDTGYASESAWLTEALAAAIDPTPVIVNTALDPDRSSDLCRQTLNMFVAIMGAEAGNLALKVMSTGGVFVGGGIPKRILTAMQGGRFMQQFHHKGRLSTVVMRMPVNVIVNPEAALLGAVYGGMEMESKDS